MSSIRAESCVRAFLFNWVVRFVVPSVLTLDRGAQFTSSNWTRVCSSLRISLSTTTSFHPQSNTILKRFHRSLKTVLCARLAGMDWFLHVPLVLLGLRSVPKAWISSHCSCRVVSFCLLGSYNGLNKLSLDSQFLCLIMFLLLRLHLFHQPS